MYKHSFFIQILLFLSICAYSQSSEYHFVHGTFRGTRVINGHSIEMLKDGELDFLISHRFGRLNGGFYEMFGLDQASIRFGLEYGVNNRINVGIGRSSFGKHYDSYLKVQIFRQMKRGFSPVTITYFGSAAINTLKPIDPEQAIPIQSRLAYTHQLLMARKFGDRLSIQLMPTVVHFNLVDTNTEKNDVFALGGAVRYSVSKNVAVLGEYFYVLPNQLGTQKKNSLSLGLDIDTGGHVFQIHLTNSQGMIEKVFIGETTGDWLQGDIQLGFNISRIFKLKGRRY